MCVAGGGSKWKYIYGIISFIYKIGFREWGMLAGEGLLFLKQAEGFVFDGTDSDKNSEFLASFLE